ncbi:MAG: ABC transporter ATP-binding protein, partial [Sinomicrobium sp.]|nr:ABC transporter ATP-binding protein [Sinomicrobium sp.]
EALRNFQGTLILVSHDRDFLQGLTDKVYEFKDNAIKEYLGDIDFYLEARNIDDLRAIEKKERPETQPGKKSGKLTYETQKKLKSLRNKLSKAEAQITALEKQLAEVDMELAVNYDEVIAQPGFFDDYKQKKDALEALMASWESIHEAIAEAEAVQGGEA